MKFSISKTSMWSDEVSPCEDAKQETIDRIEVRTLPSFDSFDDKFGLMEGPWLSKGIDHKINDRGYVQRTHVNDLKVWTMELKTLEDLMSFYADHGSLIIEECPDGKMPHIEIYDDYRE